jgi:hypothetical protein
VRVIWDRCNSKVPGLNTVRGLDMSASYFVVVPCQVRSLGCVDLTSRDPYQMSEGFVALEQL